MTMIMLPYIPGINHHSLILGLGSWFLVLSRPKSLSWSENEQPELNSYDYFNYYIYLTMTNLTYYYLSIGPPFKPEPNLSQY